MIIIIVIIIKEKTPEVIPFWSKRRVPPGFEMGIYVFHFKFYFISACGISILKCFNQK